MKWRKRRVANARVADFEASDDRDSDPFSSDWPQRAVPWGWRLDLIRQTARCNPSQTSEARHLLPRPLARD